jgi:hypothetical protein
VNPRPDIDWLRANLGYAPHSGALTWLAEGTTAIHRKTDPVNHLQVQIGRRFWLAAHIAYAVHTGAWCDEHPLYLVDGDARNLRWANLAVATDWRYRGYRARLALYRTIHGVIGNHKTLLYRP